MDSQDMFTLDQAQKEFAKRANVQVWELLGKSERTPEENEEMVYAAYASLYHWRHVGRRVHRQRGEWLIAHVHAVLGEADLSMQHARRCLELTEAFNSQMEDFDLAYAYEAMARAHAMQGDRASAEKYYTLACATGDAISDAENKGIFLSDFESGEWYGIR
jgi:tetratricopeptide (TPR) repeat protein